jgi:glycosyltransferase involved in cell wall biosynthesis
MLDYATGWGRWIVDLLNNIVKFGVEPILIIPKSQIKFYHELGMKRFETHFWGPEPYLWFQTFRRVNLRGIWDLIMLKRNLKCLANQMISLIHAADLYPRGVFAMQLKRIINTPLLLTSHSSLLFNPKESLFDRWLCNRALNSCDRISPVSNWSKEQIHKVYPHLKKAKFSVIYNGVNIERLNSASKMAGNPVEKPESCPVLLSVTRFIRSKGIETSILAFEQIKKHYPNAKYYIVGPHTVKHYILMIKTMIKQKDLKDIFLVGKVDSLEELCRYYKMADVLIHTSKKESFGLIFLEAGYFRLPIVATKVGGVPEVITHGENGLLVQDGDYQAVADAVRQILNNRKLATHMGQKGFEKATFQTAYKMAEDYYALYTEMVSGVK